MKLGQTRDRARMIFTGIIAGALLALAPQGAFAQPSPAAVSSSDASTSADAVEGADQQAVQPAGDYTPMGPEMVKGQPVSGGVNVQKQFSANGQFADKFHEALVWVMVLISLMVLLLLFWVIVRYNKRANPTPSKTTHNTMLEVVWTLVPVLVLVGIAVPSISLLARQFESPPKDAVTVKAIGVQWYWEYEYPDNDISYLSKMLNVPGKPTVNAGVRELGSEPWDGPAMLEVDNRLVVPAGVPLRIQTTANDVIHSFAVPSLWFKLDAVPGRLNERMLTIKEPGIYYGQCSELCGEKHGFMPIAVEALPMDKWKAWVRAKGGKLPDETAANDETSSDAAAPAGEEASEAI